MMQLTLFILIDFPTHIDTISMGFSILYFKGLHVKNFEFQYISVPEDIFTLANSADLDEMLHYAAFHLGLHCLPKYCLPVGLHRIIHCIYQPDKTTTS